MLRQARQLPEADALSLAGALASPTHPVHQQTMVGFLRSTPFVDGDLLDAATMQIEAAHAARTHCVEQDVLVHGDFTPGNILVETGEITGVMDFEYAQLGPASNDLAMPWIWVDRQAADIRAGRFLDWLREEYAEPFQVLTSRCSTRSLGSVWHCGAAWSGHPTARRACSPPPAPAPPAATAGEREWPKPEPGSR